MKATYVAFLCLSTFTYCIHQSLIIFIGNDGFADLNNYREYAFLYELLDGDATNFHLLLFWVYTVILLS